MLLLFCVQVNGQREKEDFLVYIAEILIVCGVVTREVSVFALNKHILHAASPKVVCSLCETVENRSCCCCEDTIAALILDVPILQRSCK